MCLPRWSCEKLQGSKSLFHSSQVCEGLVEVGSCSSSVPTLWHPLSLLCLALDRDGGRGSVCSPAKPCAALWYPNKLLGGFKRHQPEDFLERLCAREAVQWLLALPHHLNQGGRAPNCRHVQSMENDIFPLLPCHLHKLCELTKQ